MLRRVFLSIAACVTLVAALPAAALAAQESPEAFLNALLMTFCSKFATIRNFKKPIRKP